MPKALKPEIAEHMTIGFNSTTRYLENLAKNSVSTTSNPAPKSLEGTVSMPDEDVKRAAPSGSESLAAIFIPKHDQSSKLYAHIPILVQAANSCGPALLETRLVILPLAAEAKLSAALQIPRVGIIGFKNGAPMASGLIDIIRARVPLIVTPWVDQAIAGS